MGSDAGNLEEESSASVLETSPFPSNAESLARKSPDDEITGWDIGSVNCSDVASDDPVGSEVVVVDVAGVLIPLVGPDNVVSCSFKSESKAANSGE